MHARHRYRGVSLVSLVHVPRQTHVNTAMRHACPKPYSYDARRRSISHTKFSSLQGVATGMHLLIHEEMQCMALTSWYKGKNKQVSYKRQL